MFLPRKILEEKLRNMLAEDLGQGDITTALTVAAGVSAEAEVICKEPGVIAGIEEVTILLESLGLKVQSLFRDGDQIVANKTVMKISGDAGTMLSAERTVLNLVSRMSGIATTSRQLVEKIKKAKLKARVACTRKVAPGLLYFDKKAFVLGGGDSHRLHLDDMILIKDNHIKVAGSLQNAVKNAKKRASFTKKIEVEVTSAEDAVRAAEAGADIIMLDNFSPSQIRGAVKALEKTGFSDKVLLEASGGITAKNILAFASEGVDIVSLGEATESAIVLDLSLEVKKAFGNKDTKTW